MKQFVHNFFTTCADGLVSFSRARGRQAWFAFLIALSFSVTFITFPTSAQGKLSDVQGHWAQGCIEQLAQKKIISGYPDGSFKPGAPVTRAEFAAMIGSAFPNAAEVRKGISFADVPAKYWAKDAIAQAYKTGFLSGYPASAFQPNQKIPRVQALVSLASGLKYSPAKSVADTLNAGFADATTIPSYAREAIAGATEKGLVVNYPNARSLNPNQLATRADVAAFLCQAGVVDKSAIASLQQYVAGGGTTTPPPTAELRGVWLTNVDSNVLFEKTRLSNAIQRLKELNFNTLYPTVWNWGYTLYPSDVAKNVIGRSLDPEPGLKGRDILKEIVDQGHQKGMAVIPWFEFGFMAPADSDLAKRHPDWLLAKSDRSKIWMEGPHQRVWLNPFRPDVQQFIQDLVVEIVSKYDVDGIQFDDHFGFPFEFGYDDFTVQLYKQENQGKAPPKDPKDPAWTRWRADKVTAVMKRMFTAVKARKQNVLVAVSPNPQEFSYTHSLADWQSWERQGLIEELIVQVYRDDLNRFTEELNRPEVKAAKAHIPVAVGILSGVKPHPVGIAQLQDQVQAARKQGLAGMSFFFYESLWNMAPDAPAKRQSALKSLFSNVVARPNVLNGWKPLS